MIERKGDIPSPAFGDLVGRSGGLVDRLDKAGVDLAAWHGLVLVRSAGAQSSGDAWCDAVEAHGEQVALIHIEDGRWSDPPRQRDAFRDRTWHDVKRLYVRFPWWDVVAGAAIRDTLADHGFAVEWNDKGGSAVQIVLDATS